MFLGTFNSFRRFREIMTSNKTKEEVAKGGPLRVTTQSWACEPVPEFETDHVANSGAQSGSVSDSWLVMLSMVNYL